jgi:hypothetical protein
MGRSAEESYFSLLQSVRPVLRNTQVTGTLSLGVKQQGRETDYLPFNVPKFKNKRNNECMCGFEMYGYVYVYVWDCNCEGGCNVWELYLCDYIGNV